MTPRAGTGGDVFVGAHDVTGGDEGINASTFTGVVTVDANGTVTGTDGNGIRAAAGGKAGPGNVVIDAVDVYGGTKGAGILAKSTDGLAGDTIDVTGTVSGGTFGIYAGRTGGTGGVTVNTGAGDISGTTDDAIHVLVKGGVAGTNPITITTGAGALSGGGDGIYAKMTGSKGAYGGSVYVTQGTGAITAVDVGINAYVAGKAGLGSYGVTVDSNGDITSGDDAIRAATNGSGDVKVTTKTGTVLTSATGDGIDTASVGGNIDIYSNAKIYADPGILAATTGTGDINIDSYADIYATTDGIKATAEAGTIDIDVTAEIDADGDHSGATGDGISAKVTSGDILISTTAAGTITGNAEDGIYAKSTAGGSADVQIQIDQGGAIGSAANAVDGRGIDANQAGGGLGDVVVNSTADIYAISDGIWATGSAGGGSEVNVSTADGTVIDSATARGVCSPRLWRR